MLVWNTLEHDARVRREAATLVSAGHAVTVFALHAPEHTNRREQLVSGVRIRRVGRLAGRRLARAGASRSLSVPVLFSIATIQLSMLMRVVGLRPDVVHAHDVNMLPIGWASAALSGARLVYDAHEISTGREGYGRFRGLVARVEGFLIRRADAVITTTELRSRYLARAYRVQRPLVLQNRPVMSELPARGRLRRELGIAEGRAVVLYQGGLQPGRGLELIVRAAAKVGEADFVFVGSGSLERRLRTLAAELDVTDHVHFVPMRPVEELQEWTVDADIGLQVLENTCFNHFSADSNKLFEYVVAGIPVVASDLPEIRRIVEQYGVGLLVRPGSLEELVTVLGRLLEDSSLRDELRRKAAASRRFLSWGSVEGRLLELYSGLSER